MDYAFTKRYIKVIPKVETDAVIDHPTFIDMVIVSWEGDQ